MCNLVLKIKIQLLKHAIKPSRGFNLNYPKPIHGFLIIRSLLSHRHQTIPKLGVYSARSMLQMWSVRAFCQSLSELWISAVVHPWIIFISGSAFISGASVVPDTYVPSADADSVCEPVEQRQSYRPRFYTAVHISAGRTWSGQSVHLDSSGCTGIQCSGGRYYSGLLL